MKYLLNIVKINANRKKEKEKERLEGWEKNKSLEGKRKRQDDKSKWFPNFFTLCINWYNKFSSSFKITKKKKPSPHSPNFICTGSPQFMNGCLKTVCNHCGLGMGTLWPIKYF